MEVSINIPAFRVYAFKRRCRDKKAYSLKKAYFEYQTIFDSGAISCAF